MWVSRKVFEALEKRIADLEARDQGQHCEKDLVKCLDTKMVDGDLYVAIRNRYERAPHYERASYRR